MEITYRLSISIKSSKREVLRKQNIKICCAIILRRKKKFHLRINAIQIDLHEN